MLTRYGTYLRDETISIQKRQAGMLRGLQEMRRERNGSLSISFFNGMMSLYPPGFFEAFVAEHPGTAFHFFAYQDDEHGRRFANMDVDLFFSTGPMLLDGMVLEQAFHYPMYVLVSRKHPLARFDQISLEQLRGCALIALNSDVDAQNQLQKEFAKYGITISSVLSISNQALSYCLIREQNAVSFYAGPDSLLPPDMVKLPVA